MKYIGIDGCKKGWFFVSLDDNEKWKIGVVKEIKDFLPQITDSKLVLIDIPIGLKGQDKKERLCDKLARKVLGNRRSSVFPAPCREAIYCLDENEASQVNEKNTGRKLSKQSWAISGKIKEVDLFIQGNSIINNFREMHPEVCFWALNNKQAMVHPKKQQNGIDERLEILSRYCPQTQDIFNESLDRFLRKEVAKDDILDAMIGAVTAKLNQNLETIPNDSEIDDVGIKMEIVYSNG
ncbi:MAG: DUF429 domain-containing protein [Mariprofundaceae bacterium]|nr:DUF429 domain-containing protein [Mariprofundaceae bacterium]